MTLYVRNEGFPLSFNQVGSEPFRLPGKGETGSTKIVPASVAVTPGFARVLAAPGRITMSTNSDLSAPTTTIPPAELAGDVRKAATQTASVAATTPAVVADLNALIAKLKAANLMA